MAPPAQSTAASPPLKPALAVTARFNVGQKVQTINSSSPGRPLVGVVTGLKFVLKDSRLVLRYEVCVIPDYGTEKRTFELEPSMVYSVESEPYDCPLVFTLAAREATAVDPVG